MISRFILDYLSPPYLVVRVMPRLFHISMLPDDLGQPQLEAITRAQGLTNGLDTCLVGQQGAHYFISEAGRMGRPRKIPFPMLDHWSAVPVIDRLRLPRFVPLSPELFSREAQLAERMATYREKVGRLLAESPPEIETCVDPTKGGREPNAYQLLTHTGWRPDGVRLGLERCALCEEWRGWCLDPTTVPERLLVPVHCLCDNDNACAHCRELFAERRLNGNVYDESTHTVQHVPGFAAIQHRCAEASDCVTSEGGIAS